MKQHILLGAMSIAIASTIPSCSKTDSSTATVLTCPSTQPNNADGTANTAGGYVLCLGDTKTASITLAGGSGQQYVIAPYTLGDVNTVTGASNTTISGSKIAATSAALQEIHANDVLPASLSDVSEGEAMRMVVNQFDRTQGLDQPAWLWSTLKRLDLAEGAKSNLVATEKQSLAKHFRGLAKTPFASAPTDALEFPLTTATCPTAIPKVDNAATTFTATSSYDGTSFCVVYASTPISDTKTNIQNSLAAILTAYKGTIYSDQFTTNTLDGYSFNPVIVIVDPTDASMWPKGNSSYKFTGAFSLDATTVAKRPIIYLMDDMSAVQSGIDATKATRLVHATMAHEMQHAIMDYYRNRGATIKKETVAVDEGIAHMFEDAFGYGADNYTSYVQTFLSGVPDGKPALDVGDTFNSAASRGGENSFMYFLAERAGGFTVTSNRPFSGGGMTFIVNLVKQTAAIGPAALQTTFGSQNLAEQLGQFFGAVFSDNKSLSFAPATFGVAQYDNVADLQSATNKTFGIRFNNFRGFTSAGTNNLTDAANFDLKHYGTFPVLVTPSAATATVSLTLAASATNNGVAVIRVK